jgi:SAM-dependent methyltransferase
VAAAVTFAVQADVYDSFVGRYGDSLGRELVTRAGLEPGMSAFDVGAGTGKLTGVLAAVVGEPKVSAVDPSETFVEALATRFPAANVRQAAAEDLPFAENFFDAVFAQLVVNFMSDPERGVAEMRRVATEGGEVAAAVWDYPGEMTMLTAFWRSAAALDPSGVRDCDERTTMAFSERGELGALWRQAGLRAVEDGEIVVSASYSSFDELWEPFTMGVGPAGAYAAALTPGERETLREEYREQLGSPAGPFELQARAWYAVGKK